MNNYKLKEANEMKKTKYNITYKHVNGRKKYHKTITGRVFTFGGVRFGLSKITVTAAGNLIEYNEYIVTELTTGFSAGRMFSARTQKEVISRLTGDAGKKYLQMIRSRIAEYLNAGNKDANAGIIPAEDVLTV